MKEISSTSGQAILEFAIVMPLLILTTVTGIEVVRLLAFKATLKALTEEIAAEGVAFALSRGVDPNGIPKSEPLDSEVEGVQENLEKLLGALPFRAGATAEIGFQKNRVFTLLNMSSKISKGASEGLSVRVSACLPFLAATLANFNSPPHAIARNSYPKRDCFGAFRTQSASLTWRYFIVKAEAFAPSHANIQIFTQGLSLPSHIAGLTPTLPDVGIGQEKTRDNSFSRLNISLKNELLTRASLREVFRDEL